MDMTRGAPVGHDSAVAEWRFGGQMRTRNVSLFVALKLAEELKIFFLFWRQSREHRGVSSRFIRA
jgi:hypothetical protein